MSAVEQIKSKLSIADLVGAYVKLEKAGTNLKARCPFHNEKTASFFVSPIKDAYHCFGCNKGGDIFSFIQEIEGVPFIDALKILADRAGVTLDKIDSTKSSNKSLLFEAVKKSTLFYKEQLSKNRAVLDYLKGRGLTEATIDAFDLGFAPDSWRELYDHLKNTGVLESDMEKAGLVAKSPKGYYDRFRNRIMFPLHNSSGLVVGFSGRIFDHFDKTVGERNAKYINSPETEIYDKSAVLYGFDKAKVEIRRTGQCIAVEGQMDLIMSHQAGTINSVAISGTALTPKQLTAIKRLAGDIILAFDSDSAGLKATHRSAGLALSSGFNVLAVDLSGQKDPADLILENRESWSKIVSDSSHIIDFFLNKIQSKKEITPERMGESITKTVLPLVLRVTNSIARAQFVNKISRVLGVDDKFVWEELAKITHQATGDKNDKEEMVSTVLSANTKTRTVSFYEKVIGFLNWQNSLWGDKTPDWLPDFMKRVSELEAEGELLKIDENLIPALALEAELYYSDIEDPKKELDKLADILEEEILKNKLGELMKNLKKYETDKDEEKVNQYLTSCQEISLKINRLKLNY